MFHLFFRLSYHYLQLHSAHLIINIILCIVLIGLLLQYLVNVNTAGRHQQAVPAHHAGPEDAEARQGDASSSRLLDNTAWCDTLTNHPCSA